MESSDAKDLDLIARAVGLVVLQGGQAEQSLELLVASLWQSFSGHKYAKRIPVLLTPKLSFAKARVAGTPAHQSRSSSYALSCCRFQRHLVKV